MPRTPVSPVTPADPDTLVTAVRHALAEGADLDRAPRMQAYMKSVMPFRGVPSPVLTRVCRDLFAAHPLAGRADWERAVRLLWDGAYYREERYAALALTGHRLARAYQDPDALDLYRHLVVTGAWWDYVDEVASNRVGPVLRAHPDQVTPVVRAWAVDENLWLRRTALLAQLGSKTATDTDLLDFTLEQNLADSRHGEEFFIRKAVGWALREHAKTDPAWVRAFVAEHEARLSPLSRREALKHLGAGT